MCFSETGHESEIIMTGWRGKTSCRVYVPKFERHHVLRLCGIDPDEGKNPPYTAGCKTCANLIMFMQSHAHILLIVARIISY